MCIRTYVGNNGKFVNEHILYMYIFKTTYVRTYKTVFSVCSLYTHYYSKPNNAQKMVGLNKES